jgi:hypothetical protein
MSHSAVQRSTLEELRADLDRIKLELAQTREMLRGSLNARPSRFLTRRAAGQILGLGTARIRQLIAAGALRTVPFPNGAIRVPRSEIERIDALGLEVALRPAPGKVSESAPEPVAKAAV